MPRYRSPLIPLLLAIVLGACASPRLQDAGGEHGPARLATDAATMDDGYRLPLRHWGEASRARALVLALHGFNDYSNAFAGLGDFLSQRGYLVYAYDQRGFGRTAERGRWAGTERLVQDLRALVSLLRARYPGLPVYLLGESMGGAVVLAAAPGLSGVDGVVLVAPAVWSRSTMPAAQRMLLALAARTAPGLELTGRGLHLRPTDNDPAWRAFSRDPLVIKATRVDALWGLTNLMDRAAASVGDLRIPTLVLYGVHDEIVPRGAFCTFLETLCRARVETRVVLYREGWHMLTRDIHGTWVMADIAAWLDDRGAALPSGQETTLGGTPIRTLCPAAQTSAPPACRVPQDRSATLAHRIHL